MDRRLGEGESINRTSFSTPSDGASFAPRPGGREAPKPRLRAEAFGSCAPLDGDRDGAARYGIRATHEIATFRLMRLPCLPTQRQAATGTCN
jgi:hypothetical protein